ncbi:MAG: TraB/GumN family protein, partial [Flavobacterium sp.]
MKKLLKKIFIACTALLGLASYGQNATRCKAEQNDANGGVKSLLWKISGNGITAPSYLYGTIHATCDATLEKPTLNALANTAQLYLELDLDDPTLQMSMMEGMLMKDGKTMQSMLSEADYKLLDSYLQSKLKMGANMVNNMKPAIVSTLLLPTLMSCPIQSVEQELMKANAANNKETFGLEEVKEQMAVFDAIPYQVQLDELMKAVKAGFDDSKKELDDMYALYKAKDV